MKKILVIFAIGLSIYIFGYKLLTPFAVEKPIPNVVAATPTPKQQRFQLPYDQVNFAAPLHLPLLLAGTFGEPRMNHFHAGLDIKTNSETGHPVIAIEDGYVSRAKVSTLWIWKCIIYYPS